jgi:hypothetical protein
MSRKRQANSKRSKRINSSQSTEALRKTLHQEFDDHVATRFVPAPGDQRGRDRYLKSLRRLALSSPVVSVGGNDSIPDASLNELVAVFGDQVRDMGTPRLVKSKLTTSMQSPYRLGEGLYDYYPPELPPKGFSHRQPFASVFPTLEASSSPKDTILLSVPQVGAGSFFASAATLPNPIDRSAKVWCGVLLPIDANLHGDAQGPKDLIMWAEGTIAYDYALSATPGPVWNSKPEAATAEIYISARLLRYDRQTGQPRFAPDAFVLPYLSARQILKASLHPNGVTTSPPSSPSPVVGGSFAGWSTEARPFAIDWRDGETRLLETDSTYKVAVVCTVQLNALAGPAPASAQVNAQLFLRLVTLGILPHDPNTR